MKTLRKLDLESMREELQVLQREDERSVILMIRETIQELAKIRDMDIQVQVWE